MDKMYRYQRYIYDITRSYYLLGRDRLIAELQPPSGGTVLEVGCGTGRNLIDVALKYPGARCYGLDISSVMLETARTKARRAGVEDRVTFARADATSFDPQGLFGLGGFDRVFISYALSMIPNWTDAVGMSLSACAADGSLHIVDFGDQERLPSWFCAALFAWLRRFCVNPRLDLPAIVEAMAREDGRLCQHRQLFRGYAQMINVSRRVAV